MVDSDGFTAGVAIFGKDGVETVEAVRSRIAHDVTLTTQHAVTFEAGKMAHMPRPTLRFRAFIGQNELFLRR